jgi:hypothetical protein
MTEGTFTSPVPTLTSPGSMPVAPAGLRTNEAASAKLAVDGDLAEGALASSELLIVESRDEQFGDPRARGRAMSPSGESNRRR